MWQCSEQWIETQGDARGKGLHSEPTCVRAPGREGGRCVPAEEAAGRAIARARSTGTGDPLSGEPCWGVEQGKLLP
eukprot:3089685-Alexandrium_andersonii.AAC.2